MVGIAGFLFLIGLVAALSIGVSFLLATTVPKMSWRKRALFSALAGSFIPMLLPIVVIFLEVGMMTGGLISLVALVVGGMILAAIVGYPTAYFYNKRREPPVELDVFE